MTTTMTNCYTLFPTLSFSCFGLDPETPSCDYEIHLVRSQDEAYIPPDSEAWPLYYRVALEAIKQFPGAFEATCEAVSDLCAKLRGRRALPPHRLPHPPDHGPRPW